MCITCLAQEWRLNLGSGRLAKWTRPARELEKGESGSTHEKWGVSEAVNRITASLSDFENNWLPAAASGRMSLYVTLNTLIKNNGLRNTAGPSYTPLEPLG